MKLISKFTAPIKDYLVDHPTLKKWLIYIGITLAELFSAFVFAFGFKCFINPPAQSVQIWYNSQAEGVTKITQADIASPVHLISGGASGISQDIIRFISIFINLEELGNGYDLESLLISILYFVVNIPLFLVSWFKISKRFTVFTFLNVVFTSLLINLLPNEWLASIVNLYSDVLARSIFGGLTTGISSGVAMAVGSSGGGTDIIAIYISEKKSTGAGKFSLYINSCIVILYVTFSIIGHKVSPDWNTQNSDSLISTALYTIVYTFVSSMTIDVINQKNKKQEMQIFTSDEKLPMILVHAFPHSATTVESKGAFSGKKNYMIYMVISKSEQKKAVDILRKADPNAFYTIVDLNQVYGRFYIKPL